MKNILSCIKTSIVLLIVTVILLGGYAYMLARPISYGMNYSNESEYEGEVFRGTIKFYSDGTAVNLNSNFEREIKSRYYYKNGYVFFTMATTDEAYEKEVSFINENFDEAVATPFYASRINAFRQIPEGLDDYATIYTCTGAIIFAVAGGVIELALISWTALSFILSKKSKLRG